MESINLTNEKHPKFVLCFLGNEERNRWILSRSSLPQNSLRAGDDRIFLEKLLDYTFKWWGKEPWEWSEASGESAIEHYLSAIPVSSPTKELRKDKRRSDDNGRQKIMLYYYGYMQQSSVNGCCFTFFLLFVYFVINFTLIIYIEQSSVG